MAWFSVGWRRERVFYCAPCYTLKLEPHEQITHSKKIEFISKHRRKCFFSAGRGAWPMAPVLASAFSSFRLDVAPVGHRSSHAAPGSWPMSACAVPLPLRPVPELSASGPRSHLGLDSGDGQYWSQHRVGREGPGLGWAGLAGGRRGPKAGSSQGPCWEAQPKSKARSGSGWGWWAEVQRAKLLGRPWAGRSGTRAQARHAARAPRAEVSFQRRQGHRRPLQNEL